ncbi:alpha/beta fold hydrolase [Ectothiorhodospiraceae bacterium WFHF3C12]|nr:alpha/beta fold hydrolase [Ectothiorhodospiraceae bacterium WFHF3C12]
MNAERQAQPLVLLPGLLCDDALWAHARAHLGTLADIYIPDLTGQTSIAAMAEDALAAAPRRFALAGLSMGGYVALEIMRRAPERVDRLALLNTHARPDTAEQSERRRRLVDMARQDRFSAVVETLLPAMIHPDRLDDAELVAAITAMKHRVGAEVFERQQQAIIHRVDSRPDLPAIACPTLVLAGRSDQIAPLEWMQEMGQAIPGARLAIIEDCGHMSTMERPQAATALLRDWYLYGR